MPLFHRELRSTSGAAATMDFERDDLTAMRVEVARFIGAL